MNHNIFILLYLNTLNIKKQNYCPLRLIHDCGNIMRVNFVLGEFAMKMLLISQYDIGESDLDDGLPEPFANKSGIEWKAEDFADISSTHHDVKEEMEVSDGPVL